MSLLCISDFLFASVMVDFKCCFMYYRWLCYCHVPAFCDSLPRYETTLIFGRTLLRSVFQTMRRQLLDKFRAEKEKMPPEKRTLVLTHFPRYSSPSLLRVVMIMIVRQLDLQLPVQSVYSIQHYVIKFVTDLRQVCGFLRELRFPPLIKLTAPIQLKYC